MIFDYYAERVFTKSVDVVDAGNFCLECTNEKFDVYYIFTKTIFGQVHMLKIGPILPGIDSLSTGFEVSYKKFDYKENIIAKEVKSIINDPKKEISEVVEMQPEEAMKNIPDILQAYLNIQ